MKSWILALGIAILIVFTSLYVLWESSISVKKNKDKTITIRTHALTAIIAPELSGRLMAIIPKDGENVLWVNKSPEIDFWGWKSHGGEKTWIGPQNTWNDVIVSESDNWPPPKEFDGNPYEVVKIHKRPGGGVIAVEMLSEPVEKWNLRVKRVVSLNIKGQVTVWSRLEKADESKPVNAPDGMRFTNWSVAQFPVAEYVDVYLSGQERVKNGDENNSFPMEYTTNVTHHTYHIDNEIRITTNRYEFMRVYTGDILARDDSVKAWFDSGSMSFKVPGGTVYVSHYNKTDVETAEPDRGQIYVTGKKSVPPGAEPYMEIEFSQPWPDSEQTVMFFVQ